MTSYYQQVGNLVTAHPLQSAFYGFIFACIIIVVWSVVVKPAIDLVFPSTKSPFGTLNMGAGSIALDPYTGSCLSGAGHDSGRNGGCGTAEPFAAPRARGGAQSAAQRLAGQTGVSSHFLNVRGDGPESGGNQEASDYWSTELANPGGATDAGSEGVTAAMQAASAAVAQTVAAVQSGQVSVEQAPAVAAAAASSFAAQRSVSRFSTDDALARCAMGHC